MPPRENQNYSPPSGVRPMASRRIGPVDGFAPRGMARPLQSRMPESRSTPIETPALESLPASVPSETPTSDEVKLPLAGPTPTASTPSQPLSFAPPNSLADRPPETVRKRRVKTVLLAFHGYGRALLRRKILIPCAIVAAIMLVGWGAYAGLQYVRTQASPDTIYADALANALMVKQVEVSTQTTTGKSIAQIDLSNLKHPRVSTDTTEMIGGASFGFKTYGTTSDSFMAYSTLPTGLSATTSAAIANHWVELRIGGRLPAGINATISSAADPRYQAFGPLLFANLDSKTSQKTADFLVAHKVYGYTLAKVQKVTLGDKQALLFSGTFDADYSKIANQSLATSEGFSISDVQRVVDSLTAFKGATSALYIDPGKRLPLRLVLTTRTGQSVTYDYDHYNAVQLPARPSSSIDWPQFATTQLQLEAQATALLTPAQRDSLSQNALATIQISLGQYYSKNGFYPSLANLNNQTWIATNLPSFDPDIMRDPRASSLGLLAAVPMQAAKATAKSPVAATPIYGYIYQAANAAGKTCANEAITSVDQRCATYSLTALLSNGQPYTVKNPS